MSSVALSIPFQGDYALHRPAQARHGVGPASAVGPRAEAGPPVAPAAGTAGRPVERRGEQRHGVDALVNVHLPSAARFSLAEVRTARLINVSRHGAQIACHQLPGIIGDRLQVDLPGLFGAPIALAASIVGIRARDAGSWTVSLRFVAPVGVTRRHLERIMDMLATGR